MPKDTHPDDPVGDDVQWYRDPDGTEWFVDEDIRFELADDGFAYPVVGGTTDPRGATPLEVVVEDDDGAAVAAEHVDAPDVDDTADTDGDTDAAAGRSPFAPPAADRGTAQQTTRIVTVKVDREQSQPAPERPSQDGRDDTAEIARREDAATSPSPAGAGEPLLDIRGLDAGYGALPVLHGVDLQVRPGETAVLLGLNGAGKTTTVSAICGALTPWGGQVLYDGTDVSGWNTSRAVANGVVMVPEGRRVFPDLSVHRNLQVGAWARRDDDDWFDQQREVVFDYFPRLREREQQLAGTLSGGEQQMLAVGRGLMADPRLLIIDEASMGLAPVIVQDVFDIIAQINQDGVTVLMVEQNVGVLEVADIGYVMEQGHIARVLEGDELRDRSVVSAALMG